MHKIILIIIAFIVNHTAENLDSDSHVVKIATTKSVDSKGGVNKWDVIDYGSGKPYTRIAESYPFLDPGANFSLTLIQKY